MNQELGDAFGGDFDEFDEFGVAFAVCLLHLGMRLMSLGVRKNELGRAFETGAWR